MVEEKKEKKSEDRYVLKQVVTQTDTGVGLVDSEDVFTDKGLLVEILNKLDRIERAVA
jgi:hypothetical protein